jgi:hypothetical protein
MWHFVEVSLLMGTAELPKLMQDIIAPIKPYAVQLSFILWSALYSK